MYVKKLLGRRDLIWLSFQGALTVTFGVVMLVKACQDRAWLWVVICSVMLTLFVLVIGATIYGIRQKGQS